MATLQLTAVYKSDSEQMCLESATENSQTVCFNDWGWKIVPDGWYGWTKSTAAICRICICMVEEDIGVTV